MASERSCPPPVRWLARSTTKRKRGRKNDITKIKMDKCHSPEIYLRPTGLAGKPKKRRNVNKIIPGVAFCRHCCSNNYDAAKYHKDSETGQISCDGNSERDGGRWQKSWAESEGWAKRPTWMWLNRADRVLAHIFNMCKKSRPPEWAIDFWASKLRQRMEIIPNTVFFVFIMRKSSGRRWSMLLAWL